MDAQKKGVSPKSQRAFLHFLKFNAYLLHGGMVTQLGKQRFTKDDTTPDLV